MSDAATATPAEAPAPRRGEDGYIDFYGYAPAVGGWLFCGWSRGRWRPDAPPPRIVAHFAGGRVAGEDAVATWHPRPDLGRRGAGLVVLLRAAGQPLGELVALDLLPAEDSSGDARPVLRVPPVRPVVHLRESDLIPRVRATLMHAAPEPGQARLLTLLSRRAYAGADTLHELPVPVQIGVDEVVAVPPDGLALIGWCLDPADAVAAIRVRGPSGARGAEPLSDRLIPVERPDVIAGPGAAFGLTDPRVGFVAYAHSCGAATVGNETAYLEVELRGGEIGYKRLSPATRTGAAAARRLLEAVRPAPDEIESAFDRVLGPALTAIHRARLSRPRPAAEICFGEAPDAPECSVIVPLYGRMDFLGYQMALLSEHPSHAAHEIIYVLDDPPRKRELLDIAHSAHRRFGLPFRIVAPEENLGFGPANNLGLSRARGEFVCLLNSDVMPAPDCPGWLDILLGNLRADPSLGLVGALLLFEDGTVQHEGITFERLPQQANWPFPMHPRKGLLPRRDPATGPEPVEAVTGACMVLRRDLANDLGGFDEAYAIGDFEDSDLCLRLRARGLTCAVDRRARLYHLERQSQVTPDNLWRHHGTLLNAWTHTRRWFPAPGAKPGGD